MPEPHSDNPAAPVREALYTQVLSNLQGRLEDGEAAVRDLAQVAGAVGRNTHRWARPRHVDTTLRVLGDRDLALVQLDRARAQFLADSVDPLDRDYSYHAWLYAAADEADEARAIVAEYRGAVPDSLRADLADVDALIAEAEGDLDTALRFHRAYADTASCPVCAFDDLGRLHERMGRPADLHEQAGRSERAARYHAELVELWRYADPVLQPRVEAARRALIRLTGEAGSTD